MSEQEPEVEETVEEATDEEYENPGIKGQIQYPEPQVDAERAGAFAAGEVDTLEPEDESADEEAGEGDVEADGE